MLKIIMTCTVHKRHTKVVMGSFRSLVLILGCVGGRNIDRISYGQHVTAKKCLSSLKSTSKLTIHEECFVVFSILPLQMRLFLTFSFFFLFFDRNCSHFKVRHVAQVHPVPIAKQPQQLSGEGIKVESQFAMPADFTINYTMWVSINFKALAVIRNGKLCLLDFRLDR